MSSNDPEDDWMAIEYARNNVGFLFQRSERYGVGILMFPQEHKAESHIAEYLLVSRIMLAGLRK